MDKIRFVEQAQPAIQSHSTIQLTNEIENFERDEDDYLDDS